MASIFGSARAGETAKKTQRKQAAKKTDAADKLRREKNCLPEKGCPTMEREESVIS
ncbi:MAG TPA: hypothetical protein PK974_00215 [Rhodocyclaceae bacterium]|nr:hypothetical protein [Rhodocyclaceae bacterium]